MLKLWLSYRTTNLWRFMIIIIFFANMVIDAFLACLFNVHYLIFLSVVHEYAYFLWIYLEIGLFNLWLHACICYCASVCVCIVVCCVACIYFILCWLWRDEEWYLSSSDTIVLAHGVKTGIMWLETARHGKVYAPTSTPMTKNRKSKQDWITHMLLRESLVIYYEKSCRQTAKLHKHK